MRPGLRCWLILALLAIAAPASAQLTGFQLNRYEPTPSGSWFFAVEHPYYSGVRSFAVGTDLGYAHNPLRYGEIDSQGVRIDNGHPIIEHQLVSHVDFSATLRDRVLLNVSVPLVLFESGQSTFGITPISTVAVSDPRLSATVRLHGQPHQDRWSAHASLAVCLPLRAISGSLPQQTSDAGARLRAAAIFSGVYRNLIWSSSFALVYRSTAQLGTGLQPAGTTVGPDVQIGLAAGLFLPVQRIVVGPELLFSTSLLPSQALGPQFTSVELLVGAQHNLRKYVLLGLAGGLGFVGAPGTPDARVLFRIAFAPLTRDRDQDGIPDTQDACPDQKGIRSEVPSNNGCPPIPDRDCDGIPDSEDECPEAPEGKRPDPTRIGCPFSGASARSETPPPAPLQPPASEPPPSNEKER